MRLRLIAVLLLAMGGASLAGCTSGGAAVPPTISAAWVRPAMSMDQPAAAYLTITNGGGQADALLSAASPGAASVELHQTSTDTTGMTGMHPVARLDVPAGGTVKLEPGGYHLMIMGLAKPLEAGSSLELDLVFEHAGKVVVQAEVRQG
jgi:periplasmic copper chaperone A